MLTGDADKLEEEKKNRRVRFPSNEKIVTAFIDPPTWKFNKYNSEDIYNAYAKKCQKLKIKTTVSLVNQIKAFPSVDTRRLSCLFLKGCKIDNKQVEAIEEILKRVQFITIDLENCLKDDEACSELLDSIEYYESCLNLVLRQNKDAYLQTWKSLCHILRKKSFLESLDCSATNLMQFNFLPFARSLKFNRSLQTLDISACNLSGRPFNYLIHGLKNNETLRNLSLKSNRLTARDMIVLKELLEPASPISPNQSSHNNNNYHMVGQFCHVNHLDMSFNPIQDTGAKELCNALLSQLIYYGEEFSSSSLRRRPPPPPYKDNDNNNSLSFRISNEPAHQTADSENEKQVEELVGSSDNNNNNNLPSSCYLRGFADDSLLIKRNLWNCYRSPPPHFECFGFDDFDKFFYPPNSSYTTTVRMCSPNSFSTLDQYSTKPESSLIVSPLVESSLSDQDTIINTTLKTPALISSAPSLITDDYNEDEKHIVQFDDLSGNSSNADNLFLSERLENININDKLDFTIGDDNHRLKCDGDQELPHNRIQNHLQFPIQHLNHLTLPPTLTAPRFIKTLNLTRCQLSPKAMIYFDLYLSHPNCQLETLNLSHNIIGDEGIIFLKSSLTRNSLLRNLVLNQCKLGDQSAIIFAEVIGLNNFDVKLNCDGGPHLKNDLTTLSSHTSQPSLPIFSSKRGLVCLDLRHNPIKLAGVIALAKALKFNRTLHYLGLDEIRVSGTTTVPTSTSITAAIVEDKSNLKMGDLRPQQNYFDEDENVNIMLTNGNRNGAENVEKKENGELSSPNTNLNNSIFSTTENDKEEQQQPSNSALEPENVGISSNPYPRTLTRDNESYYHAYYLKEIETLCHRNRLA